MALSSLAKKTKKLRQVIKLHANWLVYATLGESALTKYEVEELVKYGKLPMDATLDLVDKSYLLGRLKSLVKRSEYKQVTYEEAAEKADKMKLSSLEELVVEQARIKAGNYLKNLANEISNGVFDSLATALGSAITEATVRDLVADETALALIQKKTSQELASSLAARLQTGPKKTWRQVAETELHRAKVSGYAQAIINRVDIYAHSDGPNSNVSIVPSKSCCADCSDHYLDSSGTPKVFKLVDLLSAGSNSDDGVVHTKKNGKHTHWKTTLPPMHPSCGCQLVYVPPGYGWADGKLSLLQKSLFEDSLKKARAGVRSPELTATVKPKGPPQPSEGPKIASQPGAAAPGNVPGPGRPPSLPGSGGGAASGGGGGTLKYAACPFGGGEDCRTNGGNGAENHKMSGSIMKKHQDAIAKGAKPKTEQGKEQQEKQAEASAAAYDAVPHPRDVKLTHLSEGDISSSKKLGEAEGAGVYTSYKVTIAGNGAACMKPPPTVGDHILAGFGYADGAATTPRKRGHVSEAAAYQLSSALGLEHVPETVVRNHDGSSDMDHYGGMSIQSWQEGYLPLVDPKGGSNFANVDNYEDLFKASADPDKLKSKLKEIACLDFIVNNNDRHHNNLVFSPDLTDVKAIDHGAAFGTGMQGHKNGIQKMLDSVNDSFVVPEHLLTKFKNQSFDQTKRQLAGSGLEDWQVAQTHLRMKYLSHLQDKHGSVPAEVTRHAVPRARPEDDAVAAALDDIAPKKYIAPNWKGWDSDPDKRQEQIEQAHSNWEMPDHLFSRFAKSYISGEIEGSDLTESDRKELTALKPALPLGTGHYGGGSPEARQQYWDSIPAYSPMPSWGTAKPKEQAPIRKPPPPPPVSSAKRTVAKPSAAPSKPKVSYREQFETGETFLQEEDVKPVSEAAAIGTDTTFLQEEDVRPVKKSLFLFQPSRSFPLDILGKG